MVSMYVFLLGNHQITVLLTALNKQILFIEQVGSSHYLVECSELFLVKGNTATNVQKNAVVETGASIKVPIFINEGDMIRIDTREGGSYLERA